MSQHAAWHTLIQGVRASQPSRTKLLMPLRLLLTSLTLLQLLCMPAYAVGFGLFDTDFDAEKKPWDELQAQLPTYPDLALALAFEVPSARPTQFFVDPKSITVGADGVVRFSLIAQSASGVLNVSHEGLRCETREKKLYAFGRKDGTWSRNKFAQWEAIPSPTRDPQHAMLYNDFFCPQTDIVRDAGEAISALNSGIHPRAR